MQLLNFEVLLVEEVLLDGSIKELEPIVLDTG